MVKKFIELQEAENLLKNIGAPGYAINALCLAPSYEAVHRSAYDQCAWERDLAIEQLRNDYGVGLGEKKSAYVVEVKRGRWTLHDDGSGTCDQCHFTQKHIWDDDGWQNYCGVCGADMRERRDNE